MRINSLLFFKGILTKICLTLFFELNNIMEQEENHSPTKAGSKIPALVSNFKRSNSVRVRGEKANLLSSIPTTPFPSIAESEEIADDKIKYWNKHRLSLNLRSRVSRFFTIKTEPFSFLSHDCTTRKLCNQINCP